MVLICAGGKVFRAALASSIWVAQIALTHTIPAVASPSLSKRATSLATFIGTPSHDSPGQGWGGSIQLISGGSEVT